MDVSIPINDGSTNKQTVEMTLSLELHISDIIPLSTKYKMS